MNKLMLRLKVFLFVGLAAVPFVGMQSCYGSCDKLSGVKSNLDNGSGCAYDCQCKSGYCHDYGLFKLNRCKPKTSAKKIYGIEEIVVT